MLRQQALRDPSVDRCAWAVAILLIFALGRPAVLRVDDFGDGDSHLVPYVQNMQAKPKALAEIGLAWVPYCSITAWYLWRASDEGKRAREAAWRI